MPLKMLAQVQDSNEKESNSSIAICPCRSAHEIAISIIIRTPVLTCS